MKKILAIVGFSFGAQALFACDLCAVYSASQARGEAGRGFFGGIAEQFTHFGTVQVDGHEINDPSRQYMDSSISQMFAGYNFNDRVGLQFNAPIIYRHYKRPDDLGGIERGSESGLGDCSVLANIVPWSSQKKAYTVIWDVLLGIKFPTGDTGRIREELEEVEEPKGPPSGIHGHDLTLGSGSYDGIIGTSLYGRWHKVFLSASTQYAIRSRGDFGYQFADDLTWTGGPGYYLVLNDQYTFSVQALVSGEHKEKDDFRGETAEDTGITAVYAGPQLIFTWDDNLSVFLSADLPVVMDNTALQTVPDYRLRAGFTWRF